MAYPECKKFRACRPTILKKVFYDCVLFDPRTVAYAVDVFEPASSWWEATTRTRSQPCQGGEGFEDHPLAMM
jgi:hypothetical protein